MKQAKKKKTQKIVGQSQTVTQYAGVVTPNNAHILYITARSAFPLPSCFSSFCECLRHIQFLCCRAAWEEQVQPRSRTLERSVIAHRLQTVKGSIYPPAVRWWLFHHRFIYDGTKRNGTEQNGTELCLNTEIMEGRDCLKYGIWKGGAVTASAWFLW